jgi:glycosyltransferase involved in cell wall biosynthesis
MKILFLSFHEILAPRLLLEIRTLLKEGHDVRVLAWNSSGKAWRYDFPVTFIHNQSRVSFERSLKQGFFITLRRIVGGLYPRTFKELLTRSWDVVHCNSLVVLPPAVLAKFFKGGKIIHDSYEFPSQTIPGRLKSTGLASLFRMVIEQTEKLLLSWVDAILTIPSVGDGERQKFAKRCNLVEVLMNVPTLEGIVSKKSYAPPPTAIYTGALSRDKGLYAMLEATANLISSYPEFKLVLVGYMIENQAEMEEKIDNLGIRKNVVIHSWVSPDELGDYISQAWVGLWPNQAREKFNRVTTGNSRKGFEYMKYGLPVVASSYGEIAKAVAEEQAGFLTDASNPEALAQAVQKIIADPDLRQKMAENGLKAVRNKYNWEKESAKLITLYKALENQADTESRHRRSSK